MRNEHFCRWRIISLKKKFVGGVNNQLSVEDFSQHVQDNLGVTPINVSQNKCNNYNQSFKLTIRSSDKDNDNVTSDLILSQLT